MASSPPTVEQVITDKAGEVVVEGSLFTTPRINSVAPFLPTAAPDQFMAARERSIYTATGKLPERWSLIMLAYMAPTLPLPHRNHFGFQSRVMQRCIRHRHHSFLAGCK